MIIGEGTRYVLQPGAVGTTPTSSALLGPGLFIGPRTRLRRHQGMSVREALTLQFGRYHHPLHLDTDFAQDGTVVCTLRRKVYAGAIPSPEDKLNAALTGGRKDQACVELTRATLMLEARANPHRLRW